MSAEHIPACVARMKVNGICICHLATESPPAPQETLYLKKEEMSLMTLSFTMGKVSISLDGDVTISEGTTISEAARQFWDEVQKYARKDRP